MTGRRWFAAGFLALAVVSPWQPSVALAGETKTPAKAAAGPVSPLELQAFALAARDVFEIRRRYAPKVQSARSEIDARDFIVAAEKEMGEAIARQGMTVARYNEILRAAQRDPALAARIQSLVDKAAGK